MNKVLVDEIAAKLKQFKEGDELLRQSMLLDAITVLSMEFKENKVIVKDLITTVKSWTYALILMRYAMQLRDKAAHSKEFDISEVGLDEFTLADTNPFNNELDPDLVKLPYAEAFARWKELKYCNLMLILDNAVDQLEAERNNKLPEQLVSFPEQANKIRVELFEETKAVFQNYSDELDFAELWKQAEQYLDTAVNSLKSEEQKITIRQAAAQLKVQLTNPISSPEEKMAAFKLFSVTTKAILTDSEYNYRTSILSIAAVVFFTIVGGAIGFGLGFLIGLCMGPGAVYAGIVAGVGAACSVLITAGLAYAAHGPALGFFAPKEIKALETYVEKVKVIDESMAAIPTPVY